MTIRTKFKIWIIVYTIMTSLNLKWATKAFLIGLIVILTLLFIGCGIHQPSVPQPAVSQRVLTHEDSVTNALYAEYEAWAAVTPIQCSNLPEKRIMPATLGGFVDWLEMREQKKNDTLLHRQ